ncbi:hypothetical protein [Brunnivagina elsteri]|uniref:Flagellar assembly protein H n=1 Tax=Brunnivagina elsteri CCALA 953 TaxID=987040 RepID=A0A2A2TKK9_9CYAN|nr:hypothetical protein [Calothrix elsteri]PAX57125.1 hypothetical protein CK510_09475 [Calothrix elsteri CCALA 953]
MARNPFDQFSKQFFEEFLSPLGEVRINYEIPGEAKFVDIWFTPSTSPEAITEDLGMLGRIAQTPCLLEPYRKQPTNQEIRSCLYKLYHLESEIQRQIKRDEDKISEEELPQLWIIATSCSQRLLQGLNATEDETWEKGVYALGSIFLTRIIAIDQLPITPNTLWLRLLGKGLTQKQAVDEVIALSKQDTRRSKILKLLYSWKISIEVGREIDLEEREDMMQLSQAYLEWEQETKGQGIEQGIEQERRQLLENLFLVRFGGVDSQLVAIIPSIACLSSQEYATLLLELPNLSREDLLARFGSQS